VTAAEVFSQNDGGVTKAYYAALTVLGCYGELAVALFRAQKRSDAAKRYRRGRFRRGAYDVKNWSLSEIVRLLPQFGLNIRWGWGRDESTPNFEWVLYIDLPCPSSSQTIGQVSFHSATRLAGPDYHGAFDGARGMSGPRILRFCDAVMSCGFPVETTALITQGGAIFPATVIRDDPAGNHSIAKQQQPLQTCVHQECVVYEVRASGIRMAVCAECRDRLKRRLGAALVEPAVQIILGETA
jgi:hypothetical protein